MKNEEKRFFSPLEEEDAKTIQNLVRGSIEGLICMDWDNELTIDDALVTGELSIRDLLVEFNKQLRAKYRKPLGIKNDKQ